MTVPMLARIDGTDQFTHEQVENLLRDSVSLLSRNIAIDTAQLGI
jgi:hypothetical protein